MYLQYRNLKLIEMSGRIDKDNEKILSGDYLDKSPKYKYPENYGDEMDGTFLQPIEIPFEMPSKDEMMKYIFSDWQAGDILVIADSPLKYPKVQGDTLVEMTLYEAYQNKLYELKYNEAIYKDDILVLEQGQYVDEEGVLQTVPKIDGVKVEWNWETNKWEDLATPLEVVQSQYKDYEGMDTPSTLEEMKQQDPALATEYLNMMIELRGLIYTLSASETQAVGYAILPIPQPSKALKEFKNKFKLTK